MIVIIVMFFLLLLFLFFYILFFFLYVDNDDTTSTTTTTRADQVAIRVGDENKRPSAALASNRPSTLPTQLERALGTLRAVICRGFPYSAGAAPASVQH